MATTRPILVEDCSPLIQYAPPDAWQDAQVNDTLVASYSGGSYHVTSTQGATATLQFRGIGFTITGGRRPGYGPYSVLLDGQQIFIGNPAPAPNSDINNTLASISGLSNDLHTVVLTNAGGAPVDIDAITFEAQVGDASGALNVTSIDDNDPRITYTPTNGWVPNPNPAFYGGTLHLSAAPNAIASLQFTGNAVAFYGTVSPDHADVSVTIDDKITTMPSGSASHVRVLRPQVLMFWADDLEDGQHTMTISKVQSANTGPYVDVDSFVVYSSAAATATGVSSPDPVQTSKPSMNRVEIIAGASVAGVVVLLLFILGLFLFFKYRRRRQRLENAQPNISPMTPILPMQGMTESGTARHSPTSFEGGTSAFPFPPSASLPQLRNAPQRLSKLSGAPSYYGRPDFAVGSEISRRRDASDPFTSVPPLAVPVTPESLRTVPVVVTDTTSSPLRQPRPSRPKRPPTLHIGSLDSIR